MDALIGIVPPPKICSEEQIVEIARDHCQLIDDLCPDAVMIYHIQDEKSRNNKPRPYKFRETVSPEEYLEKLKEFNCQTNFIVYHALSPQETVKSLQSWVSENRNGDIVLVGRTVDSEEYLTIPEAVKSLQPLKDDMHQQNVGQPFPMHIGGIAIAERHTDRLDEHLRIEEKVNAGMSFFTSQIVYNADPIIHLLSDIKVNTKIVITFAPFGSEKTKEFLEWLGVDISFGTCQRILSKPSLKERVDESVEVCLENWKRIRGYVETHDLPVEIGFAVECVSRSKTEKEGMKKLFNLLKNFD